MKKIQLFENFESQDDFEIQRYKLISEIYKHAEVIKANKTTIVFLLATMTDKALIKFHKEFMEKQPYNG